MARKPKATAEAVATPVESPTAPASESSEEKTHLLSEEAFALRQADRRILWPVIHAAFPGRPDEGGQVTAEEYTEFRTNWIEENGAPDYLLTQDALNAFRKLMRRKPKSSEEDQIREMTGKTYGVTAEDLEPLFGQIAEETGRELDGDSAICYIHKGKFQPRMWYVMDRDTNEPRTHRDGTPIRAGNFLGLPQEPKDVDELRELGAIVAERKIGSETGVVVAACNNCRQAHLRGVKTFSQTDAVGYLERLAGRQVEQSDRAAELKRLTRQFRR